MAFETNLTDHWVRKQVSPGTEFRFKGNEDRLIVRKIEWVKPGFSGVKSSGWAIFIDGEQCGPAHSTATKAMRYAEEPGVALLLGLRLFAGEGK
jgi:hypothetical protein